jgi:hypothetical protein
MLKSLRQPNTPDRFEAIKNPHYHLYFEKCGKCDRTGISAIDWESRLKSSRQRA